MDDFDRQVVCIAGLPFDVVDMAGAVARVREAVAHCEPCFVSTPNLNFLIGCLGDAAFRLGRLDRATRDYQPPATSGDLAAIGSSDLMHRRARDHSQSH